MVNILPREVIEIAEDFFDGMTVCTICSGEENEVVSIKQMRQCRTSSRDFNRSLEISIHSIISESREEFHCNDKEIKGQGFALSDASGRFKERSRLPINKDGDERIRDAEHDEPCKALWYVELK